MPPIKKLDPALVNKIAAGEVIERPASVAKELIENALDAGATRVDITIEEGGARLIRVSDNGRGITRDDLPMAVAPHATSKIANDDDLFNIRSLGFRGEALASIGSVSHLRICSRTPDQHEAYELTVTDGQAAGPKACAAQVGTTVEVRNLFYNVPARRKFLRRPPTEFGHVTEQLARLSLAHPHVAFTLAHNGRTTRNLPASDEAPTSPDDDADETPHSRNAARDGQSLRSRRTRIADFYGAELADCLIAVDREERGLRIEALIAPPDQSRASTKWQYLFLNGRFITDRRIGYAVREAFRGLVENDRFPVVFVFLTTDPGQFDVNVHPTKIEVRWRDAGLVQSQVLAALRETLLSHDLSPRLRTPIEGAAPTTTSAPMHQQGARQALADYLKSVDPTQTRIEFRPPPFPTQRLRPSIAGTYPPPGSGPPMHAAADIETSSSDRDTGLPARDTAHDTAPTTDHPRDITDSDARAPIPPAGAASDTDTGQPPVFDAAALLNQSVMQIHNTYIVAQTDDGIVIIDQHALHERILYEKFRRRILSGHLESQRLLIPQTLEVSPAQAEAAECHSDLLQQIGIDLAAFGPAALAVQGFPTLLHDVEINGFVIDLLDKLTETGAAESGETLIHAALDMMACKAAVKAGDALTAEEMQALLAQRHLTEKSSNCPHGRPTTLQLSTHDLEKQFKRL